MKAFGKDILRTIAKNKKRFASIAIITALGVTMFTGLSAGCEDLRQAADDLFDEQDQYDIQVVSTLGLDDDDVAALCEVEGVETAQGIYYETVLTEVDSKMKEAQVEVIYENGLGMPTVLEGQLPSDNTEIAVTQGFLDDTGAQIGDTLILESEEDDDEEEDEDESSDDEDASGEDDEEDDEDSDGLNNYTFTITGVVLDSADLVADSGASSYRSSNSVEYYFYVDESAVDSDIYTAIEITVTGAKELSCYSDEYTDLIKEVTDRIKQEIKEDREQARYYSVVSEAQDELDDAIEEMEEEFAEADEEIADAQQEIEDGWAEIEDGRQEIEDAQQEIEDGWAEIEDGWAEVEDGWAELEDGQAQLDDALSQIEDGEAELSESEAEASEQFALAYAQIEEGYAQIEDALSQIEASEQELADGREQLEAAIEELEASEDSTYSQIDLALSQLESSLTQAQSGLSQLEEAAQQIEDALSQLSSASEETDASADAETSSQEIAEYIQSLTAQLEDIYAQIEELEAGIALIEENIAALNASRQEAAEQFALAWEQIEASEEELEAGEAEITQAKAQIEASFAELDSSLAALKEQESLSYAQIEEARAELEEARAEIEEGLSELEEGRQELLDAEEELKDGEQELIDAEEEISEALLELEDGEQELLDGEEELEDAIAELADAKEEAYEEIDEAQADIDDIDMATWYVRDRSYLESYSTVESDADSIESIGTIFPIMFLAVAILISLTTITRMVEENRGLIGVYKALGFHNRAIYLKYFVYTMTACAAGGLAGCFFGFIALPKFLFTVFAVMYKLESYPIVINWVKGILGIVMFMIAIVGAALLTCRGVLMQMPATLMRPKTPKAGSRIFLENITFIWKRLKFLNKVTARNLFRYKKRLLMTIAGITGCTALVIVGLSIRDTVTNLRPSQYDEVYAYDIMAVSLAEDFGDVENYISSSEEVSDYITLEISSIEALNTENNEMQSVQLYVVPDDESLAGYITLRTDEETDIAIPDDGILVTENMADVMYFDIGDMLQLQTLTLDTADAEVIGIVDNYLGNAVYISESYYNELFGDYETNAVMAHLVESCEDHIAFTETLDDELDLISCLSTQELKDDFSMSFQLINSVVVVITLLAAALAFVVLFTLATTNISEREREIATIKVLGFFDREVHLYINKETMILTCIGIILGLPVGYILSMALEVVLHLPAVNYAAMVAPVSFFFAAVITFVFALIVNIFTNKSLDNVVMVEALKSVE